MVLPREDAQECAKEKKFPIGSNITLIMVTNPMDREPEGLPSMGSHRVGHDRSCLAAAAAHSLTLFRRGSKCFHDKELKTEWHKDKASINRKLAKHKASEMVGI